MKKTIIFIAGLLTFAVLATACLGQTKTDTPVDEQSDTTTDQPILDVEELEDDEDVLPVDPNITKYNEILDEDIYDIDECDDLDDERLKELCMNEAYTRKAIDENNISLCDKITRENEKSACIIKVEEFHQELGVIEQE